MSGNGAGGGERRNALPGALSQNHVVPSSEGPSWPPGELSGLPSQPANILLDEHGHVRISDLGLACDFSKKRPHASV